MNWVGAYREIIEAQRLELNSKENFLKAFDLCCDVAVTLMDGSSKHDESIPTMAVFELLVSSFKLTVATTLLALSGYANEALIIARAVLENASWVELIKKDVAYGYVPFQLCLENRVRSYKRILKDEQLEIAADELKKCEGLLSKVLKDAKAKGINTDKIKEVAKKSIRARFDDAGLVDVYDSTFSYLSYISHGRGFTSLDVFTRRLSCSTPEESGKVEPLEDFQVTF